MTPQETKAAIEVMQAYVEGKKIQCRPNHVPTSNWKPSVSHDWDWENFKYRVKPEPRQRWLVEMPNGTVSIFSSETLADFTANNTGGTVVKLCEVFDD